MKKIKLTKEYEFIYVSLDDLLFFTDFNIYVNLTRLEETKDKEIKEIRLQYNYNYNKYICLDDSLFNILSKLRIQDIDIYDYKEKDAISRYNNIIKIDLSIIFNGFNTRL